MTADPNRVDLDELDAAHVDAAKDAIGSLGELRQFIAMATLHNHWPSVSAELRRLRRIEAWLRQNSKHQPTPPNPTLALLEEARRYACENALAALGSAQEPAGGEGDGGS